MKYFIAPEWCKYVIGHCSVISKENNFYLFFHGTSDYFRETAKYNIGILESTDLFNWKYIKKIEFKNFSGIRIYGPSVIQIEDNYYELYFGRCDDNFNLNIYSAFSNDCINWTLKSKKPLFPNKNNIYSPFVFKRDKYYMLYTEVLDSKYNIKMASSKDRETWEDEKKFCLKTKGKFIYKAHGSIIKINDDYYLYYTARKGDKRLYEIRLAISKNGLNFEDYKYESVVSPENSKRETSLLCPYIFVKDKTYYMFYESEEVRVLGETSLAISNDGLNWKKYDYNPILRSKFRHEIIKNFYAQK